MLSQYADAGQSLPCELYCTANHLVGPLYGVFERGEIVTHVAGNPPG
jgi:hypothetical protein